VVLSQMNSAVDEARLLRPSGHQVIEVGPNTFSIAVDSRSSMISLNQGFAEARRLRRMGQAIPADVANLLTRLSDGTKHHRLEVVKQEAQRRKESRRAELRSASQKTTQTSTKWLPHKRPRRMEPLDRKIHSLGPNSLNLWEAARIDVPPRVFSAAPTGQQPWKDPKLYSDKIPEPRSARLITSTYQRTLDRHNKQFERFTEARRLAELQHPKPPPTDVSGPTWTAAKHFTNEAAWCKVAI